MPFQIKFLPYLFIYLFTYLFIVLNSVACEPSNLDVPLNRLKRMLPNLRPNSIYNRTVQADTSKDEVPPSSRQQFHTAGGPLSTTQPSNTTGGLLSTTHPSNTTGGLLSTTHPSNTTGGHTTTMQQFNTIGGPPSTMQQFHTTGGPPSITQQSNTTGGHTTTMQQFPTIGVSSSTTQKYNTTGGPPSTTQQFNTTRESPNITKQFYTTEGSSNITQQLNTTGGLLNNTQFNPNEDKPTSVTSLMEQICFLMMIAILVLLFLLTVCIIYKRDKDYWCVLHPVTTPLLEMQPFRSSLEQPLLLAMSEDFPPSMTPSNGATEAPTGVGLMVQVAGSRSQELPFEPLSCCFITSGGLTPPLEMQPFRSSLEQPLLLAMSEDVPLSMTPSNGATEAPTGVGLTVQVAGSRSEELPFEPLSCCFITSGGLTPPVILLRSTK